MPTFLLQCGPNVDPNIKMTPLRTFLVTLAEETLNGPPDCPSILASVFFQLSRNKSGVIFFYMPIQSDGKNK